jgi:DNA-binding NarL/FixJ family response regulator
MPYNPNDPNSDEHNPEGTTVVTTFTDPILNAEDLVRHCHPQAVLRNQVPEALETVEKLGQIWNDYRERVITKAETDGRLDALISGDIATYITDPITLDSVNQAIEAIRAASI